MHGNTIYAKESRKNKTMIETSNVSIEQATHGQSYKPANTSSNTPNPKYRENKGIEINSMSNIPC
jgi:hypothetical protein